LPYGALSASICPRQPSATFPDEFSGGTRPYGHPTSAIFLIWSLNTLRYSSLLAACGAGHSRSSGCLRLGYSLSLFFSLSLSLSNLSCVGARRARNRLAVLWRTLVPSVRDPGDYGYACDPGGPVSPSYVCPRGTLGDRTWPGVSRPPRAFAPMFSIVCWRFLIVLAASSIDFRVCVLVAGSSV
jgi:hypothetical protein